MLSVEKRIYSFWKFPMELESTPLVCIGMKWVGEVHCSNSQHWPIAMAWDNFPCILQSLQFWLWRNIKFLTPIISSFSGCSYQLKRRQRRRRACQSHCFRIASSSQMSLLKGWKPTWREPMVNSMTTSWRAVQSRLSSDLWSLPCHTSMHHYSSAKSLALETFLELLQVKVRPLRWKQWWPGYCIGYW